MPATAGIDDFSAIKPLNQPVRLPLDLGEPKKVVDAGLRRHDGLRGSWATATML
jgi:hypothetical protein